mmetsp:Transcript_11833/g.13637  ORF Transcript_11833/g.13637 Transcript_11833/m.13637 type:complete len:229 (-) Transcript_11833:260-946(-)|eukprot:CAMPEP_0184008374 /NCGR_PEP_ID=MMETSP0954-20121128/1934_1 /TAXON_ID=627963 /ORGANISM="Aplanochytrium sp, Strain PBS07" /LENGTH=228 /DNA_ID=CAMNT_0026287469 /DNA_START=172 /DNA_END=858 /DNA_ORIENTATION=-
MAAQEEPSPSNSTGGKSRPVSASEASAQSGGANANKTEYSELSARLASIGEAGRKGALNSYGPNKEATLRKIESIRKSQVDIFRKHMGLELSLSEKVDKETEAEDGEVNSKKLSEVFQAEFHEKENELQSITKMIDSLSSVLRSVNKETRASQLPTEPGREGTQKDLSSHGRRVQRTLIGQRNSRRQSNYEYSSHMSNIGKVVADDSKNSEWKQKLALNPSRRDDTQG